MVYATSEKETGGLYLFFCSVSASLGDGRFGSAVWKSEDEFNFNGHNGWKLTLSEECNAIIREDFLYEQVSFAFIKRERSRGN